MGPSALDNMRSLEYYLHDMMHNPHDGHDPCKGDYPVTLYIFSFTALHYRRISDYGGLDAPD